MVEQLKAIFDEALQKYKTGEEKHGVFTPDADKRDLLLEAEQELLDTLNYVGMHLFKIRSLRRGNLNQDRLSLFRSQGE